MSEQKTFNIGGRVRFIRDYDNEFVYVDKGDCGTIESVDDNLGIRITLDSPEFINIFDTDYIELITPTDPKTAFLSELKGLLERYGYSISSGINFGESDTYKAFGGMGFISSDESRDIDYNPKYGCITPNNIMDYEKE